jgi:hypothetical protein
MQQTLKKKVHQEQNLNTAVNFLELTRARPFENLKTCQGQKLEEGAGEVTVTALDADLCQITLNCKNFSLTTLRSKYE